MEASGFGTDIEQGPDPFGEDGGLSEFEQGQDPLAGEGEAPVPVVDREGQIISEPPPPADDATAVPSSEEEEALNALRAEQEAAEGQVAAQADGEPDPATPAAASPETAGGEPGGGEPSDPTRAASPSPGGSEDPLDHQAASEAMPNARVGSDGQPIGPPKPTASTSSAEPGEAAGSEPQERKKTAKPGRDEGESGTTRRSYVLLVPEGADTFKLLSWREDKDGNIVSSGGKKVSRCTAKSQEEALAIGHLILGSPTGEVKMVAVPESMWKVTVTEAAPPPPPRLKFRR